MKDFNEDEYDKEYVDKVMRIFGIVKILFTLVFFAIMCSIEPIFIYILGGAIIIALPIITAFVFINKL